MAKSYKVAVRTHEMKDGAWSYNLERFTTEEEALGAGESLWRRWTAVAEFEVQESDDCPNRRFVGGSATPLNLDSDH